MKIKRYNEFTNEAISGTEIPENPNFSYFGPAYGTQKSPNTINKNDTTVIYSKLDDKYYTEDEFNVLYDEYLSKSKTKSIQKDFTEETISKILNEMEINP